VSPRPRQAKMTALHDREEYSKHPYFETRRKFVTPPALTTLKKLLPNKFWKKKQIKILDVGCDHGDLLISVEKLGNTKLFGIEVSQRAAQVAAKRGVRVHTLSLETAPKEFSKFDLITLIDVLEHVAHPNRMIADLFRRSGRGGYLYLETPNPKSCIYTLGIFLSKTPLRVMPALRRLFPCEHIQYFSLTALIKSLTLAGWKIIYYGNKKLESSQLAVPRPVASILEILQKIDSPSNRILSCVLAQK
jgi:2-polyprenyl-3-methyl-5-hydroxy-6-metoxy-1,4-benzoquinol methylase